MAGKDEVKKGKLSPVARLVGYRRDNA